MTALRSEIQTARRDTGDQAAGWFSYHRPAYRLQFQASAPTAGEAIELVSHDLRLTKDWTAEFEAKPL